MRPLERGLWSVWAGEKVIHPKGGNVPEIRSLPAMDRLPIQSFSECKFGMFFDFCNAT